MTPSNRGTRTGTHRRVIGNPPTRPDENGTFAGLSGLFSDASRKLKVETPVYGVVAAAGEHASHVDFGSDIGALSFVNRINKLDCKQQWFGKGHVAVKGEK